MRIMRGGQNRCITNTPTHLPEQVFGKRLIEQVFAELVFVELVFYIKVQIELVFHVRSWPAARTHTALSRDFAAAYAAYADFPELPKTSS